MKSDLIWLDKRHTAHRVASTRSAALSPDEGGGGSNPHPVLTEGVLHQPDRVPPINQMGYQPPVRKDGGTLPIGKDGVPPVSQMGVPPPPRWGRKDVCGPIGDVRMFVTIRWCLNIIKIDVTDVKSYTVYHFDKLICQQLVNREPLLHL